MVVISQVAELLYVAERFREILRLGGEVLAVSVEFPVGLGYVALQGDATRVLWLTYSSRGRSGNYCPFFLCCARRSLTYLLRWSLGAFNSHKQEVGHEPQG